MFPELTPATVIGISVAIAGNILISLALNIQKLAHKRLDAAKAARNVGANGKSKQSNGNTRLSSTLEEDGENEDESAAGLSPANIGSRVIASTSASETQPLLLFPQTTPSNEYGTSQSSSPQPKVGLSRPLPSRRGSSKAAQFSAMPIDIVDGDNVRGRIPNPRRPTENTDTEGSVEDGSESEYLKSKLW